jgi:acetyltransferase
MLSIRPIRPTDEAAEADFFAHLTPEDVRFRFFSALKQLPPKLLFRLTHIDYVGEMAFVAERANGEIVGVARLVRDPDVTTGEYAVAIRPDMKGHGLANHLMQRVLDWGRGQGMTHAHALILADNGPMIAFARKLGGRLKRDAQDSSVVRAEMALAPPEQPSSDPSPQG